MVDLRYGVVAATVTLAKGSDDSVAGWLEDVQGKEGVLLFGSSDLLVITSNVSQFDGSRKEATGRTANTYLAASLDELSDRRPRMFRALSFLRAQRPEYERFTAETLETLRARFKAICDEHDVACRMFLGYGWADLYLDLSCETIEKLFRAIVGCRAVMLKETPAPGVFHNAFTIVGVAWSRRNEVEHLDELVRPKISLRVEPTELTDLITNPERLKKLFPEKIWSISVTSGKRDIFIIPREPVRFGDFWTAHSEIRRSIGVDGSPYHKMETHFDFEDRILPQSQATAATISCLCTNDGAALAADFRQAAEDCEEMGPGLKKSFDGLANLYEEALDARDSCCDFDAAAAHYFSQRALFREYHDLCTTAETNADDAETRRVRRRRRLLHDVIDRLEVSSVFIFNQEQNGSYSDLLSRSERVSLYRGGMQKINVALLIAIDNIVRRQKLSIWPMLCWWPAGQIQSERPIGVIKVPVYFLHRPEVAFFLILHELGQLTAYEYFRKQPPPSWADETLGMTLEHREYARKQHRVILPMSGLQEMLVQRAENGDMVEYAENRGVDTGKFITDLWADVYLLRMGFRNDARACRDFLFEQFLELVRGEHGLFSRQARSAQMVARLMCLAAAKIKIDDRSRDGEWTAITLDDIEKKARYATRQYLDAARAADRFESWTDKQEDIHVTLATVMNQAAKLAYDYSPWVDQALLHVETFKPDDDASPEHIEKIKHGTLTEIAPSEITSYFRELLNIHEPPATASDKEKRPLFLARAALISSILAYCERTPRLPIELSPEKFEK